MKLKQELNWHFPQANSISAGIKLRVGPCPQVRKLMGYFKDSSKTFSS